MSGQANQPVDSSGADGQPQHQPDPHFVMLRTALRQKLLEYIRMRPSSAERHEQLPELAKRLEHILYVKFPNKNGYYNMMKGSIETQLEFAMRTLRTQCQQNQQNPLVGGQAPASSSTDLLVDSSIVGLGGTDGQPQHRLVEGMTGLPAMDQQFVLLRTAMRHKIFEYIGRNKYQAEWQRRLPELAKRLEQILYQKFPNRSDYYNMMKGPIEPQLQFAIKTLIARSQQNQQNQQVERQIPSSSSTDPAVDHDDQFEQIASLQVEMQKMMLMSTTELNDSSATMETD